MTTPVSFKAGDLRTLAAAVLREVSLIKSQDRSMRSLELQRGVGFSVERQLNGSRISELTQAAKIIESLSHGDVIQVDGEA